MSRFRLYLLSSAAVLLLASSALGNVTIPATGSGTATPVVATDAVGGAEYQLIKPAFGLAGTGNMVDDASGKRLPVLPSQSSFDVTVDVTRPADTNAYTANDTWANSTTVPTTGGFTFTGVARQSGGALMITDLEVTNSVVLPGTPLQAELWIFNAAVTAVNDNAAFTITDAEAKTVVARIPFTMSNNGGANSTTSVNNINKVMTCSGSADLRFLIKVLNAYTPSSAEVLSFRLKGVQLS
jgi:hypothetical protein